MLLAPTAAALLLYFLDGLWEEPQMGGVGGRSLNSDGNCCRLWFNLFFLLQKLKLKRVT